MKYKHTRPVWECVRCGGKFPFTPKEPNKCFKINKKGKNCVSVQFRKADVYCLDKILSYPVAVRAIVGRRRGGKTYAVAERCVDRWINEGVKTIWVRRYTTEYKNALETFEKFGYLIDKTGAYFVEAVEKEVLNKKTGEYDKKWVEQKTYICILRSITTASRMRGGIFDEYNNVVWDEYGDESQTYRKAEDNLFNSILVSTFDERDNCEVWILSNNCNRFLKLWIHAEVDWEQEWNYNFHKDIVVHIWDTQDYEMKGSLAKYMQSTEYYDYAFKNKALDNDSFFLINKSLLTYLKPLYCVGVKGVHARVFKLVIKGEIKEYYIWDACKCDLKQYYALDVYSAVYNGINVASDIKLTMVDAWWSKAIKFTTPYVRDCFINWILNDLNGDNNKRLW